MSHESIRLRVEKTIPPLEHLKSLDILSHDEIAAIIEQRTSDEFKICCPRPLQRDFVASIEYEKNLRRHIFKKAKELGATVHQKWSRQINSRVILLFERYIERFGRRDSTVKEEILKEYAAYLLQTRNLERLNRALTQAIERDPTNAKFWLMLIEHGGKLIKDTDKWRGMLTRATRMCPKRAEIYHKRVVVEVQHMAKGIRILAEEADDEAKRAGLERLAPLEDVPQCIIAAFLANFSVERLRESVEEILRPFLKSCWAPYGRSMMEAMAAQYAMCCGQVAGEDNLIKRLDDVAPVDEAHVVCIAEIRRLLEDSISAWEAEHKQPMQNIADAVLKPAAKASEKEDDGDNMELEVVTDSDGEADESVKQMEQLRERWENLGKAVEKFFESDAKSSAVVRKRVLESIEAFVNVLAMMKMEKDTLDLLQELKSAADTTHAEETFSAVDLSPETLESFIGSIQRAQVAGIPSGKLVHLLKVLFTSCGLCRLPENISIIAQAMYREVIPADFCSGVASLEGFITKAWEELKAIPTDEKAFLSVHSKRWRLLEVCASLPVSSRAEADSDASSDDEGEAHRKPSSNFPTTLLQTALTQALQFKRDCPIIVPQHTIAAEAEIDKCLAFCFEQLLQLGMTAQQLLSKYDAHAHSFPADAWKILAKHSSMQAAASHKRVWVLRQWLDKAVKGPKAGMMEAFAACLAEGSGFLPTEIERIRDKAFISLKPAELQQVYTM